MKKSIHYFIVFAVALLYFVAMLIPTYDEGISSASFFGYFGWAILFAFAGLIFWSLSYAISKLSGLSAVSKTEKAGQSELKIAA